MPSNQRPHSTVSTRLSLTFPTVCRENHRSHSGVTPDGQVLHRHIGEMPREIVLVSTITSSLKQVKFDSEKCPDLMPAGHGDPPYTEYSFRNNVTPRQCIGCDECVREICEELCASTNREKLCALTVKPGYDSSVGSSQTKNGIEKSKYWKCLQSLMSTATTTITAFRIKWLKENTLLSAQQAISSTGKTVTTI